MSRLSDRPGRKRGGIRDPRSLLLHREFLHVEPEAALSDRIDLGLQNLHVQFLFLGQGEEHLLRLGGRLLGGQVEVELVRDDLALDGDIEDLRLVGFRDVLRTDIQIRIGARREHRGHRVDLLGLGKQPRLALDEVQQVLLELVQMTHLVVGQVDQHVLGLGVLDRLGELDVGADGILLAVDAPVDDGDSLGCFNTLPPLDDVTVPANYGIMFYPTSGSRIWPYGGNKYRLRNGMICRSDIEKQSRAILKVTGNGSHSPVMSLRSSRVLPMGYSGSRWHGYVRYDKGIGRHGLSRMRPGA